MSRCTICDYSQSADSLFHNSLAVSFHPTNNRVVYSPELKKDVCVSCLEEHHQQQTFWASIDTVEDVYETETDNEPAPAGTFEIEAD